MKNNFSRLCGILVFLTLSASTLSAQNAPPPNNEAETKQIPEALKPWVEWATWDSDHLKCPTPYNNASNHICFWPSRLGVDVQRNTGRFTLGVIVFHEAWVPLPGSAEAWPLGVTANGTALPVVEQANRPSVKLKSGTYQLEGSFRWNEYPQRLQLPREIGLLSLTIEGQAVESPVWDAQGSLWLRRDQSTEETDKDTLQLKAYGLLEDGIPLWLRAEVELIVSGKSREVELGTVLPAGWKLAAMDSPIPVTVDEGGRLKAQVRAGVWTVRLDSFRIDNPTEFRYAEGANPIAKELLLAFQSKPDFRMVDIAGLQVIDVSQTTFPDRWRDLPVYRWDTSTPFQLDERMRGMGEQKPAGLSIDRELWLDENGREFTFRDKIHGERQQIWRLDVAPGEALGSVRSDDKGQLITLNPQTGRPGVEIRTRNINLDATGRLYRAGEIPATGWSTDADSLSVNLNLPPGWRLFALFGADWVHGDWLTAWSLLDLFLLLVFSLAVYRLWGVGPAVLAFVAFGLSYHEAGFPRFGWLFLLVPLALLRVVHGGWGHRILVVTKWVIIAGFTLMLIPFVARQVQQALYPQLEEQISYATPADFQSHGGGLRVPVAAATSAPASPEGFKGIQAKLENIIIPRLEFRETSLREAIDYLQKESVARDPEKKGVNIVLKLDPSTFPMPQEQGAAPTIPGLEPLPGSAPMAPSNVNPNEVRITVSLANIPLGEALRYITGLANLKFKVEQYGISVVSQGTPTETLVTKEWVVPPGFLSNSPTSEGASGASLGRRAEVRDFLAAQGIAFPPGATALYLPNASKLVVRNTPENLDLIDAITEASTASGPPPLSTIQYDPGARIQTGPGIPDWSWRTVSFGWNGPVMAAQKVRPVLIPAAVERLISLLRVLLVLALVTVLLNARRLRSSLFRTRGKAAVTVLLVLLWGATAASAQTQIPDQATLDKLRDRLLKPSDTYTIAADIPTVTLTLNDRRITIDAEIHATKETAVPLPGHLPAWSPISVLIDSKPEAALRREGGYLWVVVPQGIHHVRVEGMLMNVTEWEWTFLLKPRHVTINAPGWTFTGVRPNGIPEQQVFFALQQKAIATEASYERQDMESIVLVTRNLNIGLSWRVLTVVSRRSPPGRAVSLRIPLLPGENVLTPNVVVKDGLIEVLLGPQQMDFTWESGLPLSTSFALATRAEDTWVEQWQVVASPVWNIAIAGLPPIFQSENGDLIPVWYPWPGERVELTISRPKAVAGATVTVDRAKHEIAVGKRQRTSKLDLSLRSSLGEDFLIALPADAEITSLGLGGKPIPVRKDGSKVIVPVRPGEQAVSLGWKTNTPLGIHAAVEEVRLPVESANIHTTVEVPEDRWVLWANGPRRGPAVRFWVILICSMLAAIVLGQLAASPLRTVEWMLLVIGLTQVPLLAGLAVVGWLFFLAWRGDDSFQRLGTRPYNLLQVLLIALTAGAIGILFTAVGEGLLGRPEMFISGNDSTRTVLRWYQPRSEALLPTPMWLSVSIWWYRFLMLAWALWLAAALIRWLRFGWQNFSHGGVFRPMRKETPPPLPTSGAK